MKLRVSARLALILVLGGCAALAASRARVLAQDTEDPLDPEAKATAIEGEIDDLTLTLIKTEALAAEVREEKARIEESVKQGEALPRVLEADDSLWKSAFKEWSDGTVRPQLAALRTEHSKFTSTYEKPAVRAWHKAKDGARELAEARSRTEARVGRSIDAPESVASRRSFWLPLALGALALGGATLLTLHEGRDRWRWTARALASRPSGAALAVGLTLAVLAPVRAVEGPGALAQRRDQLQARVAAVDAGNRTELADLRRRQDELRQQRALFGLLPRSPAEEKRCKSLLSSLEELQDEFRDFRVSARYTMKLVDEATRISKDVESGRKKLDEFKVTYTKAARRDGVVKLSACGAMTAAALIPLALVRRRRARRLDESSRLCPRCFSLDTLQVVGSATAEEGAGPRQPKSRLVVCEACDYETRDNLVRQSRLCFPSVGIRASGKTHWLVNVYDQIKNKDLDIKPVIRKIASQGDLRFDQLVKELKYELIRPQSTIIALPEPLTFHVRDTDPLGWNQTMVNMFDYSGELTNFTIDGDLDTHKFRRHALLCEGFILFVDPTQVTRTAEASIDSQIQCLQHFVEEMHAMRDIPMEKPIDLPIAVCVSKMDLLVSRSPMGTEAVDLVAELRQTMGAPITLALIERRSQIVARALPRMFPGWGVERDLRESFGGRFMFFPMSAVGLEESELGNDTLSERQITPFGMLEPLLWLLHMHGYCVLR
jgi:hypothetical protein